MAVVTVVPDGDGTTLQLTPTTESDHFDEVDEGISGADDGDTTLETTAGDIEEDFLTLEAMPGDFDTAIDFQITVRTQVAGVVDDTVQQRVELFESDETTNLGGIAGIFNNHSWTNSSGSVTADSASKAAWDTRKIRLRAHKSSSGMPDATTREFTAVEVVINYDTTGPPATNKNQFWRRAGGVAGTWGRHSTAIGRSW